MQSGPAVEVRKSSQATTWYNATILDIVGDQIRVCFEDNIWPKKDVASFLVRQCPKEVSDDDFSPSVDDVVEVSLDATDVNPSGWQQGRVKTIKESFYFIGLSGEKETSRSRDMIVERTALRRLSPAEPLELSALTRRILKVDRELQTWIQTQDSQGCLSHVQSTAKIMVATVVPDVRPPEVLLIGSNSRVELATKLLQQIHFKHQLEMQRWHVNREYFAERLKEAQQWYTAHHSETFSVDPSLVGKIIGKKGENIKLVRETHGVEIDLWDSYENDEKMVRVSGEDAAAVKAAREDLEYKVVKIPVSEDEVGWTLGKGYQTLTDIAKKAELHYARFDDKSSCVEICGLQHQVETAKMLITVHQEYLSVYKDMDQEKLAIQNSFEELEGSGASKGKGGGKKGGGRGGGKGGKAKAQEEEEEEPPRDKGGRGGWKGGKAKASEEADEEPSRGKGGRGGWKGGKTKAPEEAEEEPSRDKGKGGKKGRGRGRKGDGK